MHLQKLVLGTLSLSMANVALAGSTVPLGTSLGVALGNALGLQLGTALPIAGAGLLIIAAVSLVLGIRILRRKQDR